MPAGPSYLAEGLCREGAGGAVEGASDPNPGMGLLTTPAPFSDPALGTSDGGMYAGLAVGATPCPGAENPVRPWATAELGVYGVRPCAMGELARMGTLTVLPNGLGGGWNHRSTKPKRPPGVWTGGGPPVVAPLAAVAPATPPAAAARGTFSEPAAAESSGLTTTTCTAPAMRQSVAMDLLLSSRAWTALVAACWNKIVNGHQADIQSLQPDITAG